MAGIDEQVDHCKIGEEGRIACLCGSIPPTTELGGSINGDGGDALFDASRGSGGQSSPCGT